MKQTVAVLLATVLATIALRAGPVFADDTACKADESTEDCMERLSFPPIDTGEYSIEQLQGMSDEELVALSETIDPRIAKNLNRLAKQSSRRYETATLWEAEKHRAHIERQTILLEECEAALQTGSPVDDVERVFPSGSNLVLVHLQSASAYPTDEEITDHATESSNNAGNFAQEKADLYDRQSECADRYFEAFPEEEQK